MDYSPKTPVLFCIFNRPQLTEQVFESIRQYQPSQLFIASDGPRESHSEDAANVAATRKVIENVDWECDVQTRFLTENLGCKHAMASAIDWAFEQTEQLIILEDDCLPDLSFFDFCHSLLGRYADSEEVMMISGNNFQPSRRTYASYYFSRYTHIWGWATWKSAWQHFDLNGSSWPQIKQEKKLRSIFPDPQEYAHWSRTLDAQFAGQIDTWDFPWAYSVWSRGGMAILPDENLVTNIGFGPEATHTLDPESKLAEIPACEMGQLLHPIDIAINRDADRYTWQSVFRPTAQAPKTREPYWKKLNLFRRRQKQRQGETDAA